MSALLAVHDAVWLALRRDATLLSLLATDAYEVSPAAPAVYDSAPQPAMPESETAYPFLVVGDVTAVEFDTDDVNGQEHTVTVDVWSKYRGSYESKLVADAVYAALHNVALNVVGKNTVYCLWEFAESVPEPDPLLRHIVLRFRIVTQDS